MRVWTNTDTYLSGASSSEQSQMQETVQPAARLLCRAVCFAVLFGAVTYGDLPDLSLEQGQDWVGLSRRMYVPFGSGGTTLPTGSGRS